MKTFHFQKAAFLKSTAHHFLLASYFEQLLHFA